ncbi:MAG: DUF3054 domain-containing protein [Ktedonobacterales bacterium]
MRDSVSSPEAPTGLVPAERRITGRTVTLVAGDVASFLVFAAVGRGSHGEASGLGAGVEIARTALPFALGWFVVSPFIGAFRPWLTSTPLRMLVRTELAWLASWPVAMLLRRIFVNDNIPMQAFLTFALVVLVANAVFLGVWRTGFALVERMRRG